ncbi:uncharacterized protein RAG0_14410 [Rhynchosporium agropyri]|uniref:Uncharacterized protein n=1 Tax=Rhynchosporium agropyri TaxID=914238 RepID=A0A1E1LGX2_9HELO|nr:uncharacterized protein RAG0_14410 [Rhynchosporium agropyri]
MTAILLFRQLEIPCSRRADDVALRGQAPTATTPARSKTTFVRQHTTTFSQTQHINHNWRISRVNHLRETETILLRLNPSSLFEAKTIINRRLDSLEAWSLALKTRLTPYIRTQLHLQIPRAEQSTHTIKQDDALLQSRKASNWYTVAERRNAVQLRSARTVANQHLGLPAPRSRDGAFHAPYRATPIHDPPQDVHVHVRTASPPAKFAHANSSLAARVQ